MTSVVDARQATATRFVCRSYLAVVLTPEPPIVEWIAEIDQRIKGAESFLGGAPVVVDLNAVKLSKLAIVHLISELEQRGIRVLGLENVDAFSTGAGLPPLLRSSHSGTVIPDRAAPPAHVSGVWRGICRTKSQKFGLKSQDRTGPVVLNSNHNNKNNL